MSELAADISHKPVPAKLGIIAGAGHLPLRLAEACEASGRPFFVLLVDGAAEPEDYHDMPHVRVRMGAVGEALNYLQSAGVEEIVMAGAVKRPSMASLMPDAAGARLMAKLGAKLLGGDDAMLKAIINFLEEEGFTVVGAESVLQHLIPAEGLLTQKKPDAIAQEDIKLGFTVAKALGALDVGQAVAVENGVVLAVEGAEGTDEMLARCTHLMHERGRAVLVKARKPGQDTRADLPAVGSETVRRAAAAGFAGIAMEAGGALLIDADATAQLADASGMFVLAAKIS